MRKAGQDCPPEPTMPPRRIQWLRVKLIFEELRELAWAFWKRDEVKVADALGDILYVVLGAAVSCGIQIKPVFEEIHMSKFIDGHRRADGKWVKGTSYTPANLKPILESQRITTKHDRTMLDELKLKLGHTVDVRFSDGQPPSVGTLRWSGTLYIVVGKADHDELIPTSNISSVIVYNK